MADDTAVVDQTVDTPPPLPMAGAADNRLSRLAPNGAAKPDDLPGPGLFGNFLPGVGGMTMQKFASAARAPLFVIGGAGSVGADAFSDAGNLTNYFASGGRKKFTPSTDAQDAFFGGDTLATVSGAVNYWTPDPRTTGMATQMVGGFAGLAAEAMSGGAASVIASEMVNTDLDAVDKGIDTTTAQGLGAISGLANAFGLKVPVFGSNLLTKMATGAAGNLALSVGTIGANKALLENAGFDKEAKAFDLWAPHARSLDVLFGIAAGLGHRTLPRGSLADMDAVATAANAERVQSTSAPLAPASPAGADAHVSAFDAMIAAATRGEKVDVSGMLDPKDFQLDKPNPQLAPTVAAAHSSAILANLTGNHALVRDAAVTAGANPQTVLAIAQLENPKFDVNQRSIGQDGKPVGTAVGLGQFINDTWKAMGGTDANRFDAPTQARLLAELTVKNTDDLRAAIGREPQPEEVYLAHLLGITGAKKLLGSDANALVSDVSGKKVADQNGMAGMTVAQAVDHWRQKIDAAGAEPVVAQNARTSATTASAPIDAASTNAAVQPGDASMRASSADTAAVPADRAANDTPAAPDVNVIDAYHGTSQGFDDLRTGASGDIYFSSDPRTASTYAFRDGELSAPNVRPVRVDTSNFHVVDGGGVSGLRRAELIGQAIADAKSQGRAGVVVHNVVDPAHWGGVDPVTEERFGPATTYVAFDAKHVRPRFSAFNEENLSTAPTGIHADVETARQTAAANPDLQVTGDDGVTMFAHEAMAKTDADLAEADHLSKLYEIVANCSLRGGH